MSLPSPILDDRSFEQLRDELIRRIPTFTSEWTDHNVSDPGITLIELFAFLGENLLYRFNQIPETTKLEFLNLLRIPLRPARPAEGLITMATETPDGVLVPKGTEVKADRLAFETGTEARVLPVSLVAICKERASCPDESEDSEAFDFFERTVAAAGGLGQDETAVCYERREVPADGSGLPVDFDKAVDGAIWIAVLSEIDEDLESLRQRITGHEDAPIHLNVGFSPDLQAPPPEEIDPCPGEGAAASGRAVEWQISTGRFEDPENQTGPIYRHLQFKDTTRGLETEGVVRLQLPSSSDDVGVFTLDDADKAGTGELPPQLDEEREARVLFWLRAFRPDQSLFGKVLHVGANAAEVAQARTARAEFLGTGTGQANQQYRLIHKPVLEGSLRLEVEGPDGWQQWTSVDEFHASGRDDRHYVLDAEAGTVRFGSGVQGYPPQIGERIRAVTYRFGGGAAGNVAAGAISKIPGVSGVEVSNAMAAHDGADKQSIADALTAIPGELRRRDRAVTMGDFKELALMTPGVDVGRAECLPRFHPRRRDLDEAPGVVTVVVWPSRDIVHPNAPLPNRLVLKSVCEWLDRRRLVTTELYVIPPTYRKVAVSVGIQVKPGFGVEAVRNWVELVLRQYLAPLPPYGPSGQGWPLGRRVHGPELEAAVLQVEGVEFVDGEGLLVAGWDEATETWVRGTVELDVDQVPELAEVTVVEGPPDENLGESLTPPLSSGQTIVPIPVEKEEC